KKSVTPRHNTILIGAIAVLLLVVAGGVWQFYVRQPSVEPASSEKMAYPLPDKPSIAVLPFVNMSEDPEQEYFSDGLTEEIISALSSVPNVFVIARNSTFTYKGRPVKVQQVSEELGVRYVLEGSVRKSADEIRITAQLVDAVDGHHLWAERYDRKLDDIFNIQDEIAKKIISAMQVKLTEGEEIRAAAKGTKNLQAYLKYLQANEFIYRHNPEDNAMAKKLAQEAITLDPEYASAYYVLAKTHMLDVWLGMTKSPKTSMSNAVQLTQQAIALDETLAEPHALLGWLFTMTGQDDKALAQGEKAVTLNPNSAEAHMRYGKILALAGKAEESIPQLETAIRLNPMPPNIYLYSLAVSYSYVGRLEEAISLCERAVREAPDGLFARLFLALFYGLSGREAEARAEAAEVLRIQPRFSLEKFAKRGGWTDTEYGRRNISVLRKAGLK
ncbi:MAG: tetratricopeptide repeat protein, partial [Desulfobacterales bacterium]